MAVPHGRLEFPVDPTKNLKLGPPIGAAFLAAANVAPVTHPGLPNPRGKAEIEKGIHELGHHLEDISGDPSGSDPMDYLIDPSHRHSFDKFFDEWAAAGFPGAAPLPMQVRRDGKPAWGHGKTLITRRPLHNHGHSYPPTQKALKFLFKTKGAPAEGFVWSILGCKSYPQLIAVCTDRTLRSMRGPELHESEGYGWGRLPDFAVLEPALNENLHDGVDTRHRIFRNYHTFEETLYDKAGLKPKPPETK